MSEHHHESEEEEEEVETLDQTSDENNQLEKLEEDLKLMAQKISEFRQILPDQLHNILASILSAHRHSLDFNQPGSSTIHNPENVALEEDDPAHIGKIQTIKQKISSNFSAMSSVSKRMKACMSTIENLDSVNKDIHPAFQRRKITSENWLL